MTARRLLDKCTTMLAGFRIASEYHLQRCPVVEQEREPDAAKKEHGRQAPEDETAA
jgi:hypothetical protein